MTRHKETPVHAAHTVVGEDAEQDFTVKVLTGNPTEDELAAATAVIEAAARAGAGRAADAEERTWSALPGWGDNRLRTSPR